MEALRLSEDPIGDRERGTGDMSKAILEFNLPEEDEEFRMACNAISYSVAYEEVWNRLLRPPFKHGYPDQKLQDLYKSLGDKGADFVEELRRLYTEITQEYEVY